MSGDARRVEPEMTFVWYSPGLAVVGVMAWLFCGCGGSNSPADGGTDAGPTADIGVDASFSADTGVDGALDASIDTGVNGQPSLALVEPRIAARQQQTVTFALDAADPEGDAYAVYFTGCANPQGAIQLCIDAGCTQAVTLDCTVVHDDTTVPQLLAVDPSLHGRFTAGDLPTLLAGDRYNTAHFRLDDVASLLPPAEVAVVFDVIIDNQPPMVFVQQEDREDFAISPAFGTDVLVDVTFMDPDFTYSDFLLFTVEGSLDNSLAPAAELDVVALLAAVPDCGDAVTVTPTTFSYTCTAPSVQAFLGAVKILAPTEQEGASGAVTLVVRVSDNGNYGQCPDSTTLDPTPCPMEDMVTLIVTYVAP
ncbi:MAG: hypothetical protein IPG17_18590 [Sandaracinaceae bacterium]|nr:hypothetical protein [Sandaracinaceae bacterium]